MSKIMITVSLETMLDLMRLNSPALGDLLKTAYQQDGLEAQLTAAIRATNSRYSEALRGITSDEIDPLFGEPVSKAEAEMARYCDELISALRRIARAAGLSLYLPEFEIF